jgi:hypothetical protein
MAAVALMLAACGDDDQVSCDTFSVDRAEWRRAKSGLKITKEPTAGEKRLRELGRGMVRCGTLLGKSRADLLRLLGPPDSKITDEEPVKHREWLYRVGHSPERAEDIPDPIEDDLFMEFGKNGRVVYVEAPGIERSRWDEDAVTIGNPVGGGPD